MANPTRSLRRVGRVLGTVGLASVAIAWLAHRARTGAPRRRAGVEPIRFRPVAVHPMRMAIGDGHLGAREKDFDWARTGRA